jgi:protein SCO1/2
MSSLPTARRVAVLTVSLLIACAVGCGRPEDKQQSSADHHQIRGLVMGLDPARNRVIIAHEEIPHYMKAMTMPFTVRDSSMLRGIEVGDSVRGVVTVKKPEVWLDSLTVIAKESSSGVRH